MRKQTLVSVLCLLTLAVGGCQFAQWQPGGSPHTAGDGSFTVGVPAGWMYLEGKPGQVIATEDGVLLQRLIIERLELKEPLPFSKRVLNANLTPFEVAEALTDDLRADRTLLGLEVTGTEPAQLDGHTGFRLVVSFHTADQLRVTEEVAGAIVGQNLYLLIHVAPTRYYFERDRGQFDAVVKSFRVGKTTNGRP